MNSRKAADSSSNGSPEHSLRDSLALLHGGWRVIALSFGIFATLATLYSIIAKPVYESTARLLIDTRIKPSAGTILDFTGTSAASKLTNEIETLTSSSLAEGVARSLVLKRYLGNAPRRPIVIIEPTDDEAPGDSTAAIPKIAERLSEVVTFAPIRESDIIRVTARSPNPEEAALLANTYVEVYTERNLAFSRERSRSLREFLESQVHARQHALDSAEAALREYMQTSGVVSLDAETNKMVTQLAQLEATRDALSLDIGAKSKTLESYRQELATQEPNVAKAMGESNDSYIHMLQEQLARLEVQRDVALAQNPLAKSQGLYSAQLKDVESQIATLRKNLQDRTRAFLGTLSPGDRAGGQNEGSAGYLAQIKQKIVEGQIELDGLSVRSSALSRVIADYESQFNSLPRRTVDLARLQRTRLINEKLYITVDEKFSEAAITEKSDFGYVSVIDRAVAPLRPVSPKLWLNLVIGALLGLSVGVALVFARAAVDVRIRDPQDLDQSGRPTLAVIPRMEFAPARRAPDAQTASGSDAAEMGLVAFTHRSSPLVESYRHLHNSLRHAQVGKLRKSILVTSVNQGDGKSTIVSNLAIVMAEAGQRVLLIDADVRRPSIHDLFGEAKAPGLVDLLLEETTRERVTHKDVIANLDMIASGSTPVNPAALLGSSKMDDLLRAVTAEYDVVLIDCPPLVVVTDAHALALLVDAVIVVASSGETRVPELDGAFRSLWDAREKVLGVVLNNYSYRKSYRPSNGAYAYGYRHYSGGNGKATAETHET